MLFAVAVDDVSAGISGGVEILTMAADAWWAGAMSDNAATAAPTRILRVCLICMVQRGHTDIAVTLRSLWSRVGTPGRDAAAATGAHGLRQTAAMAFGQPAGPPATAKQLARLMQLVNDAGHTDFRDARGPLGLNQRQAGGRFTRDEADALIEQLEAAGEASPDSPVGDRDQRRSDRAGRRPARSATPQRKLPDGGGAAQQSLVDVPSESLAAELQLRGWVVLEP